MLALEPWREEAHRQLMRLLALSGQRGAALAQFATCRQLLAEELDVEPGPETKKLYERIRNGELPRPDSQPDAGERPTTPTSLSLPPFLSSPPAQPKTTTLVVREPELFQLNQFLDQALSGQGRVVFITGAAGQGKTTLAETFAKQAQQKQTDLIVASGRGNAYGGIGDPYLPFREVMGMLTGDIETKWTAGAIDQEQARRLWAMLPITLEALIKVSPDLVDIFISGPALAECIAAGFGSDSDWLNQLRAVVSGKATEQTRARLSQNALFMRDTKLPQRLARQKPLLLLLVDLQSADTGSISLLFHLGQLWPKQSTGEIGGTRRKYTGCGGSCSGKRKPTKSRLKPAFDGLLWSLNNSRANCRSYGRP